MRSSRRVLAQPLVRLGEEVHLVVAPAVLLANPGAHHDGVERVGERERQHVRAVVSEQRHHRRLLREHRRVQPRSRPVGADRLVQPAPRRPVPHHVVRRDPPLERELRRRRRVGAPERDRRDLDAVGHFPRRPVEREAIAGRHARPRRGRRSGAPRSAPPAPRTAPWRHPDTARPRCMPRRAWIYVCSCTRWPPGLMLVYFETRRRASPHG